jgi:hypothetical protein
LEWLAVAQHHGLATRLLDWTRNPLVAAFFAVCDDKPIDAALYAYQYFEAMSGDYDGDPFSCERRASGRRVRKNVFCWIPDAITPRIARQEGTFTVHEPPTTPLYGLKGYEELVRIRIDKRYRTTLREELAKYGITRASLFPDLDGLANHLNWKVYLDYRGN